MHSKAWSDKVDALVAQHVMGWYLQDPTKELHMANGSPWRPTRFKAQAMMVFERCEWMSLNHSRKPGLYEAGEWGDWAPTYTAETYTEAENCMLAICLAALKKAGVEVPADA